VPWIFGQEACTVLSKFTKLKHQLEPYILDLGLNDAAQRGLPLMRAMFLEFPKERTCWDLDMQYMFGDKLLVAPVFDPSQVEYYVPEAKGKWVNLLSGEEQSGGQWYTQQLDYLSLPLLLRPDTVLVMGRESHRFGRNIDEAGMLIIFGDLCQRVQTTIKRRQLGDLIVTASPSSDSNGGCFDIEVQGLKKGAEIEALWIGGGIGLDKLADAGSRRMTTTEAKFALRT
jgi:alpha-D-xyloside xylohydrolase